MTAPRYVIAKDYQEHLDAFIWPVLDLPDAEHIHLTRLPDGTWTAVAMDYYGHKHMPSLTTWLYGAARPPTADEKVLWVDASAEPEDGACD